MARWYYRCETAKRAVAKVSVITDHRWNDFDLNYYFGDVNDAREQYSCWCPCPTLWESVTLYEKEGNKWIIKETTHYHN